MITSMLCPICDEAIAAEKAEMNMTILEHCKKAHPKAAENISNSIMEVGKLRIQTERKIRRIKRDVKRATGYILSI